MGETVSKVASEAEAALDNFLKVLLEVLLPVALFFVGLSILAPAIGLSGFYSGLLANANLPGTATSLSGTGAAVLTYGGIGGGFIMVERTYDGWFGDIIGALGWMSVGAALRELIAWLTGNSPLAANAVLSKAASSLQSGLEKAASGN